MSLLRAYVSLNRFDVLCLTETLHIQPQSDNSNLKIHGYALVGDDHSSNCTRGGAYIWYKNTLPLKVLDINYLQVSINPEVIFDDKKCNFITFYWSPSKSKDIFESCIETFEVDLDSILSSNPFLVAILGDFSVEVKTTK